MANKRPSERYADDKTIGSSSNPNRLIEPEDLIIVEDTTENNAEEKVRVAKADDIILDLLGSVDTGGEPGRNKYDPTANEYDLPAAQFWGYTSTQPYDATAVAYASAGVRSTRFIPVVGGKYYCLWIDPSKCDTIYLDWVSYAGLRFWHWDAVNEKWIYLGSGYGNKWLIGSGGSDTAVLIQDLPGAAYAFQAPEYGVYLPVDPYTAYEAPLSVDAITCRTNGQGTSVHGFSSQQAFRDAIMLNESDTQITDPGTWEAYALSPIVRYIKPDRINPGSITSDKLDADVTAGIGTIYESAQCATLIDATENVDLTALMRCIKGCKMYGFNPSNVYKIKVFNRNHATGGYKVTLEYKAKNSMGDAWREFTAPFSAEMSIAMASTDTPVTENADGLTTYSVKYRHRPMMYSVYQITHVLELTVDFSACPIDDGETITFDGTGNMVFADTCHKDYSAARIAAGSVSQLGYGDNTFIAFMMRDGKKWYHEFNAKMQPRRQLTGNKFVAHSHADYFANDLSVTLPLAVKYGFTTGMHLPSNPNNTDFRNRTTGLTSRDKNVLSLLFNAGGNIQGHGFIHEKSIWSFPLMDGYVNPTNSELTSKVSGDYNIFHYDVNTVVPAAVFPGNTTITWKDLSNANCEEIRKTVGWIRTPLYGTLRLLECLDYLSNLYLGTTGYGRVPVGGVSTPTLDEYGYPTYTDALNLDGSHKVAGGIFTGAQAHESSPGSGVWGVYNHEIWERLFEIEKFWINDVHGTINHWALFVNPGGLVTELWYKSDGTHAYYDAAGTLPAYVWTQLTSSITGDVRSLSEVLKSQGFRSTALSGGGGYYPTPGLGQGGIDSHRSNILPLNAWMSHNDGIVDESANTFRRVIGTLEALSSGNWSTLRASTNVMKDAYDITQAWGRKFYYYVNDLIQQTAWGLIPKYFDDSWTTVQSDHTSTALNGISTSDIALWVELFYMFCREAGIEVVNFTEALDVAKDYKPLDNYFPNPSMKTTIQDIVQSSNYPQILPDGWKKVGGDDANMSYGYDPTYGRYVEVKHASGGTSIGIRQYHLNYGIFTLKFRAKGYGTLKVCPILNSSPMGVNSTNLDEIATVTINDSTQWVEYTAEIIIPEAAREAVSSDYPSSNGWHNQICGLHIELQSSSSGDWVRLTCPSIK